MKTYLLTFLLPLLILFVTACGGGDTDVVESGTYTGTVDNVVPAETEIYVETDAGQRLDPISVAILN